MTYKRLDNWFWAMFELTSTWTNFSVGRFSVARMLIINGGAIRTTKIYYSFFSVWGGGGPGDPYIEYRGTKTSGRTTSYRADNNMYEKGNKIPTSDSYVGHNVSKIYIMVTKWLPEAIWDIRFWPKFSQFVISGHIMHVKNVETIGLFDI